MICDSPGPQTPHPTKMLTLRGFQTAVLGPLMFAKQTELRRSEQHPALALWTASYSTVTVTITLSLTNHHHQHQDSKISAAAL